MPRYRWPVLVWRDDAPFRMIVEDFECTIEGVVYTIPAGYSAFDGASIPRWLWGSVGHPFIREFECAALVHDYFYDSPDARAAQGLGNDREAVDKLFHLQLIADGVAANKAKMMYWGVQRFGEARFVCPNCEGFVDKTPAEIRAIELDACACAEREAKQLLEAPAPASEDSSGMRWLHEVLAQLDFDHTRAHLEASET